MKHVLFVFLVLGVYVSPAAAQADADLAAAAAADAPIVVRAADGTTTIRAIRVQAPLKVDGLLDENHYRAVDPVSDFIQAEPHNGEPATEKTDVWIAFDQDHVYVSVRAHESRPDRMIVNEMRRDSNSTWQNEHVGFSFDTFYDRRNSVTFYFNPLGARSDGQSTNEGNYNGDWNPVWNVAVRRNDGGWTAEAAIPFKSLRYKPGRAQVWGFQMRRTNRWKNELSYLTPVTAGIGNSGINRASLFATLVGVEAPAASRPLDIKPFVTSNVTTDRAAAPSSQNRFGADAGVDVKYAVTQGLTADLTYNTDFAQVEADEQQVNLTRFSLFFPEKREFFLENAGLFNFGGAGNNWNGSSDTPILFYSRRIGLDQGGEVPVEGGGRLTGRVGRYTMGVINMQTGDVDRRGVPGTNFAVARLKRDILRRSAIGAIVTRRSHISGPSTALGAAATDPGTTIGLDGTFAFFANLSINTFWAKTATDVRRGDDTSYRAQMNYNGDRYGVQAEHLMVGGNFAPEVGFLRRDDFTKNRLQVRFSPRPANMPAVRKFGYQATGEYFENGAGQKETRQLVGTFWIDFASSEKLEVSVEDSFELLVSPFRVARGVTVPAGGYTLRTYRAEIEVGQQRRASGAFWVERGPFYDGDRNAAGYSGARVKFSPRLAVEPGVSINRVTLPFGDFTTALVSSRTTFTLSPRAFVSGLVQYNSSNSSLSTNVRLRWEYQPGSELFVVYNEGRDTALRPGRADLQSRALVFKINRLLRF
ncbi:MAG: carbohydrate binding family 9 domain-containing protein [Acidimicrobiia bacterium]|nr:carbohydrate binding family 9 domain-containing protein [Acidimicrobiia bacterium]